MGVKVIFWGGKERCVHRDTEKLVNLIQCLYASSLLCRTLLSPSLCIPCLPLSQNGLSGAGSFSIWNASSNKKSRFLGGSGRTRWSSWKEWPVTGKARLPDTRWIPRGTSVWHSFGNPCKRHLFQGSSRNISSDLPELELWQLVWVWVREQETEATIFTRDAKPFTMFGPYASLPLWINKNL